MHSEYLLFNLLILALSSCHVILKRHPKLTWIQSPQLDSAWKAIGLVSVFYILWDILVTNWWWSFNPKYILGVQLGNLPLEEVLFFFIIPWSCLVIWVNIRSLLSTQACTSVELPLCIVSTAFLLLSLTQQWWYTASVCLLFALLGVLSQAQSHWLSKKSSLIFLAICILLTCIFNGYLTARPVVLYNTHVKSPVQVGTVPLEDIVYGLTLISFTVLFYERLRKSH